MIDNNPFAEVVGDAKQEGRNAVGGASEFDSFFGGGADPVETVPTSGRSSLFQDIEQAAEKETKRRWMKELVAKLQELLRTLMRYLLRFAKEAFELAVYKFTVELCAMIVASIAALVTKKSGKPMDITTDGVFFSGGRPPGQPQPQNANQSRSPWDSNPFADWNNGRNVVSPW
jgi:hypothetical protein